MRPGLRQMLSHASLRTLVTNSPDPYAYFRWHQQQVPWTIGDRGDDISRGRSMLDLDQRIQDSLQQSISMLLAVVDGGTYESVGKGFGMSRTAVERRVKSVAIQLTREVGVKGLNEDGAAFVRRLRANRSGILDALCRFEAQLPATSRPARIVSLEEITQGAVRIKGRSSRRWHDLALFYLPFSTGLRPLEIARLEIRDYLKPEGNVIRRSVLRAEAANNGKSRPLYFSSLRLSEALDAYLEERTGLGFGLGSTDAYRGLDPYSPIFFGPTGKPYPITSSGGPRRLRSVCRPLLATYRKLFRYAEITNLSTQSARLTLIHRMYQRGADEEQVGEILGISKRSELRAYMQRPKPSFDELLDELI